MVAEIVIEPGRPGSNPARSAWQLTVAPTEAGVPTGLAKPVVSTEMDVLTQRRF
jgi:hypothetical protein